MLRRGLQLEPGSLQKRDIPGAGCARSGHAATRVCWAGWTQARAGQGGNSPELGRVDTGQSWTVMAIVPAHTTPHLMPLTTQRLKRLSRKDMPIARVRKPMPQFPSAIFGSLQRCLIAGVCVWS
jgi:hypothetical protein